MSTALTLGKFAPLHKGHQHVIERALAENDHLIVLIYDAPEFTPIPLPRRAGWIRALYPQAEVIECWDGPMEVGDTPEIKRMHEAYILGRLQGRKIDRFYSSEFYGEHVSQALGAQDCRVDPTRAAIPVSGTAIRENPFAHRANLDPVVYWDLVTKVVFLGAPSTGKTTLVQALAERYNTVWMPEYGREYWEEHQSERRLIPEQLVEIAEGHREREERIVMEANRFLFIDTDATTTRQFALYYHGFALPRLEDMARGTLQRYDVFILCEDDIPYDDTWDRSGEVSRKVFQKQIVEDLTLRKIPFVRVGGALEVRVERVGEVLELKGLTRPATSWNARHSS